MAYRVAPVPRRQFAPVREVAAVASEVADLILIHRDEAQGVVDACRRRVLDAQGELNEQQTATLTEARERSFVLEIYDGCGEAGIAESMHIVVVPDLPLYVAFSDAEHETVHMPTLQRLAQGLGYTIERVATDFLLESLIMGGDVPIAEA